MAPATTAWLITTLNRATAHLKQVAIIFSEGFSDGQVLEGVRFVNPFADGFRLEDWA